MLCQQKKTILLCFSVSTKSISLSVGNTFGVKAELVIVQPQHCQGLVILSVKVNAGTVLSTLDACRVCSISAQVSRTSVVDGRAWTEFHGGGAIEELMPLID